MTNHAAHAKRRHPEGGPERSRRSKIVAAILGALLAGACAYATANWTVGLNSGSSGLAQSGTVSNLTVSAVASPSPGNLLYPGGTGDVVLTIANPNPFPVTVSAVDLPSNTTYATGYTTSGLISTQSGCIASPPSDVCGTSQRRPAAPLTH
jgi:hypothetical protein